MLEIIKDNDGTIKGVIEYYIVDVNGILDDKGTFAWVLECEIAPKYRGNGCLRELTKKIVTKYPQIQFGYFWRKLKYPNRLPKLYSRKQWFNKEVI